MFCTQIDCFAALSVNAVSFVSSVGQFVQLYQHRLNISRSRMDIGSQIFSVPLVCKKNEVLTRNYAHNFL
jgi:hypothetical protein